MSVDLHKRKFLKTGALAIGAVGCGLYHQKAAGNLYKEIVKTTTGMSPIPPKEFKTEALYFINTPKGIKCLLCPNECKIEEGKIGECRTRINENGILQCIAYGNPCAVHIDPVEKKPLFHFLPASRTFSIATAGCNLACLNCQNWEISQTSPAKTRNYDMMPDKVVEECLDNNCQSIAYTYSEPIVFYEYTLDTAKIARQQGIKNIVVSAGYIQEKPLKEWCNYIDAANIDLKSFSNEIYEMLNAGKLEPVLNTLKTLKDNGVWLEITNLVVPDWTDDLDMIKKMCDWLANNGFENYPLHFSRFHPQYKLTNLPATPVKTLEKARTTAMDSGLKYVYIGNVPGTEAENTFCHHCGKKLIARKGFFIASNEIKNGRCRFCNIPISGIWN